MQLLKEVWGRLGTRRAIPAFAPLVPVTIAVSASEEPVEMQHIKVAKESDPAKVAGAIAKSVRRLKFDPRGIKIVAVGEVATYKAVLAMGIAHDYLAIDRPELSLASVMEVKEQDVSGRPQKVTSFILAMLPAEAPTTATA